MPVLLPPTFLSIYISLWFICTLLMDQLTPTTCETELYFILPAMESNVSMIFLWRNEISFRVWSKRPLMFSAKVLLVEHWPLSFISFSILVSSFKQTRNWLLMKSAITMKDVTSHLQLSRRHIWISIIRSFSEVGHWKGSNWVWFL